ncbi:serine/arginine repetitive matrix 2 domain protein [Clostridioides difficile P31]|nr:serine/arginine repetitive matrix 2 domain protein [Clostridioides difficile P45]EQK85214.1 serine/arginine repetitive matrix 2 domain protein [Clostridioides difficile P31]
MTGNPRRRIPYPFPAYGRKCADTEPVKLANTASAVESSFAGAGVQRAASPLCRGAGAAAHCWGQGATPIGRLRAAAIIGSRVKRLAQGELMPASTRTGYYLTQNSQDLRLRRPFPGPRTSSQEGGNLFETDTTQWALRQAWHL